MSKIHEWPAKDTNNVPTFVAVAQAGFISAAAKFDVSQSALIRFHLKPPQLPARPEKTSRSGLTSRRESL
jgi:hypothetical protein